MRKDRPTLALSDLHAGVCDARDNYRGAAEEAVHGILEYARHHSANVVVCGDLLELWQCNVSECVVANLPLLDKLADLNAIYVLGNHDADLLHFCGTNLLRHKLFRNMAPQLTAMIGGRRFLFLHGHQADPYCRDPRPGKGRISAIYSGIWEDRHGSPDLNKYRSVEEALLGPWERVSNAVGRIFGRPSRAIQLHRGLRQCREEVDVVVFGHTHVAGTLVHDGGPWALNCGAPIAAVPSFVWIEPGGEASVYDWIDSQPVENKRVLSW